MDKQQVSSVHRQRARERLPAVKSRNRRREGATRSPWAVSVQVRMVAVFALGMSALVGCRGSAGYSDSHAAPARSPYTQAPCTATPGPGAPVIETKLSWRTETMRDGSVRATIGDTDAAPRTPGAVRLMDYRAPDSSTECMQVKVLVVHGWWCTTTVSAVTEQGEIVVGGAQPRARLRSAGFHTTCGGNVPRYRARYEFERDSWSGYRFYTSPTYTSWTSAAIQAGPAVTALCPQGRVGTYTYELAVTLQVSGYSGAVGTPAAGRTLRQDCGTGVS
jgi:hypothetical protein